MFNNYINHHDFYKIFRKVKKSGFTKIAAKFFQTDEGRVKESWKNTIKQARNWTDVPLVKEYCNEMISGDKNVDEVGFVVQRHLHDKKDLKAISFGCGTGQRELLWASTGKFKQIDGIDLSEPRIHAAKANAKDKKLDHILIFFSANMYEYDFSANMYDVVFFEHSLHHFTPLEELLQKVKKILRDDGIVVINEFVGPTKFQWTDAQLKTANTLLKKLPEGLKRNVVSGEIKKNVYRPSIFSMNIVDPSEAVESSNIIPLACSIFEVVEKKDYGGTVLAHVFSEIAGNFINAGEQSEKFVKEFIAAERKLLEKGELSSDFSLMICKRRGI